VVSCQRLLRSHPATLRSASFCSNYLQAAAGELAEQWPGIARVDNLLDTEGLCGKDRIAQGGEVGFELLAELVRIICLLG
jgi:hypothetical protein